MNQAAIHWRQTENCKINILQHSTDVKLRKIKAFPCLFPPTFLTCTAIPSLEPAQAWVPSLDWGGVETAKPRALFNLFCLVSLTETKVSSAPKGWGPDPLSSRTLGMLPNPRTSGTGIPNSNFLLKSTASETPQQGAVARLEWVWRGGVKF